jgi:16S rRNA (cytidine1402-2'-O)-methyltransferase
VAALYVVSTPIGNLGDITRRAVEVLGSADVVLAEDTRRTSILLRHLGIHTRLVSAHEHNEAGRAASVVAMLGEGKKVALVSDAGTPLISDPGYKLVREAQAAGIAVTTIPGPSALIAALTLAGLPTDRFAFAGFLPVKAGARASSIAELSTFRGTLVFYESGPRLAASLTALREGLGHRQAAVAREISKRFEETATGTLADLAQRYADAPPKGEIVIVVGPSGEAEAPAEAEVEAALLEAMRRLSPSRAAAEVAQRLGLPRREVYERAQKLK